MNFLEMESDGSLNTIQTIHFSQSFDFRVFSIFGQIPSFQRQPPMVSLGVTRRFGLHRKRPSRCRFMCCWFSSVFLVILTITNPNSSVFFG